MGIDWDHNAINRMMSAWTNTHAQKLASIARSKHEGDLQTEDATPERLLAVVAGGQESVRQEYGDSGAEIRPWGWPSLMEAAGQVRGEAEDQA
jgi:hypothetical protein